MLTLAHCKWALASFPGSPHTRTKNGKERGEPGKIDHVSNIIGRENLIRCGGTNKLAHVLLTEYTRISKTMRSIQTKLIPLRCWQPAHSNDINIVGLICSLGCPQWKTTKIYYPIIWGSNPLNIRQHPSASEAATTTNIKRAAAGSCSFPMVQKSCRKMLQRRNRKRRPKIHDS